MYQCETQYHRQIACCSPRNPYPCETKYRKINARGWCCSPRNLHQCETNPKAAPKIISVAVLEIFTSAKQIHRTPRPIVCVAVLEIFTSAKLNLITINVFIECCSPRNLHQCETHIRSSVYAISVAVLEIFTSAKLSSTAWPYLNSVAALEIFTSAKQDSCKMSMIRKAVRDTLCILHQAFSM